MNKELMDKARMLVAQMIEIVEALDTGNLKYAGETLVIGETTKINMKQSFNVKRVDLIQALNDVKFN